MTAISPRVPRAALRRFARRDRVDGVIVISLPLTPAEVRTLHRDGVPTVLVDVAHSLVPNVAIDDIAGEGEQRGPVPTDPLCHAPRASGSRDQSERELGQRDPN